MGGHRVAGGRQRGSRQASLSGRLGDPTADVEVNLCNQAI